MSTVSCMISLLNHLQLLSGNNKTINFKKLKRDTPFNGILWHSELYKNNQEANPKIF